MCQTKLRDAGGMSPTKKRNEVWRNKTPRGAGSDYIPHASETEVGTSECKYGNIVQLAETDDYFVFLFSRNHAQIYSKKSISGGTADAFRDFIEGVTGKQTQRI